MSSIEATSPPLEPTKDSRLDINRASLDELCTLPGIGKKRAQTIIDYRRRRPITRLTQLLRVKGIGKKTLRRLRPLLRVTPRAKPAKAASRGLTERKR